MLNISRNLILILCILTSWVCWAQTSQKPVLQNTEQLADRYVKIEAESPNASLSFSILKSAEKIYNYLDEKYHSLLNWKTLRRSRPAYAQKYDRLAHFGRWINDPQDENCFNTRAHVLIRDSKRKVKFSESNKCSVEKGFWPDDYTAQVFTNREEVQIDHFVPLKNAYMSGAHRWSFKARCLYANYLGNKFHLKAVNATENMRKGDRSPLSYMPPNKKYACTYLKNWLSVKFLWGLDMLEEEASAINSLMIQHNCKPSDFRLTSYEMAKMNEFAFKNFDLCPDKNHNQPIK